jgi:AI-2E family transporter
LPHFSATRPPRSGTPVSTPTDSTQSGEHDRADTAAVRDRGPEAAEIRTQEEVRVHGGETRDDLGWGESRVQEALETAAAVAEETGGLGTPGQPINRRSPFMIGMLAAFGVAVAYGLIELIIGARSVLIIIGLALFIAAGLDPVVGWLLRHRMPRWAAVLVVVGCAAAVAAGFLAAAIPPLVSEATALAHQIPHYLHNLQNHNSELGKLNVKYHSLIAVLIGGVLLGIIGALVAIPVAAAIRLLLHEIAIRRLDKS